MVPFSDLSAQYRAIRAEVDAAVAGVLESSAFVLGPEVAAFEDEFAAYTGSPHAIAVNSGTSALHLALLAAGVRPGDEVVTAPFTFVATVAAILYTGARPVFADIDPRTFTLDPALVEAALTPRTRAIVPVHLYGQPADMDPILNIARRRGIVVIEDAAQAHGATYKGRPAGGIGDMGCFSFYPGKNLGACGEAGLVTAAAPDRARAIRMLRDWGGERRHEHSLRGYNYRMDALQGAILRVKLRHLEAWTQRRRHLAALYGRLLSDAPVEPPAEAPWAGHVWHVYAVRSPRRAELQRHLDCAASRPASITPCPCICSPPTRTSATAPAPSPAPNAPPPRCSPCRCIRR
jgi:dTDP-4-amino-4,6-dideoxygalactose transaminase